MANKKVRWKPYGWRGNWIVVREELCPVDHVVAHSRAEARRKAKSLNRAHRRTRPAQ